MVRTGENLETHQSCRKGTDIGLVTTLQENRFSFLVCPPFTSRTSTRKEVLDYSRLTPDTSIKGGVYDTETKEKFTDRKVYGQEGGDRKVDGPKDG